jgi:hypothetical protein
VERAQRFLIGFPIGPHLRFRLFLGNVSRGASPPSDYSAVSHPSLPVSRAYPVTRAAFVHGSSTSVRPRRYAQARGPWTWTNERTNATPASRRTPTRQTARRATRNARRTWVGVRASNAPTAFLGPFPASRPAARCLGPNTVRRPPGRVAGHTGDVEGRSGLTCIAALPAP